LKMSLGHWVNPKGQWRTTLKIIYHNELEHASISTRFLINSKKK